MDLGDAYYSIIVPIDKKERVKGDSCKTSQVEEIKDVQLEDQSSSEIRTGCSAFQRKTYAFGEKNLLAKRLYKQCWF